MINLADKSYFYCSNYALKNPTLFIVNRITLKLKKCQIQGGKTIANILLNLLEILLNLLLLVLICTCIESAKIRIKTHLHVRI